MIDTSMNDPGAWILFVPFLFTQRFFVHIFSFCRQLTTDSIAEEMPAARPSILDVTYWKRMRSATGSVQNGRR